MRIKDRLHLSYSLISLAVLIIMGAIILLSTQKRIAAKLDAELGRTNLLVYEMVENVFDLNRKNLLRNLGIMDRSVEEILLDGEQLIDSDAEHYITQLTDYISIETLKINGITVFEDATLVDRISDITGGHSSILQLVPHGLLRISTSIRRTDGSRATQVYFPDESKVTGAIRNGQTLISKTIEMGQWYLVAYKPVYLKGEVVGALEVISKPDIESLRTHILSTKIGLTGTPFIVDTEGILVIAAENENENVYHLPHIKAMIKAKGSGKITYRDDSGRKIVIAYQYQPNLQWIIASGSYVSEFYGELGFISWIIIVSLIIALLIIVIVSQHLAENISDPINQLTLRMVELRELQYDFSNFNLIDRIRKKVAEIDTDEEEIKVLTATFGKMLEELEEAHKQIISRHRKFREEELIKKVDDLLLPDHEILSEQEPLQLEDISEEAAGDFFDISRGPDSRTWYLAGFHSESHQSSGLFMMLAQTFLNSVFRNIPDTAPAEAANMLNGYLAGSLGGGYNFSIVVSSDSGWIQYAGVEKELKIFREDSERCERIPTRSASLPERGTGETRTATFKLHRGTLLFLHGQSDLNGSNELCREFSRIVKENWNESADEMSLLFHKTGSASIFLLKRN
jgi:hypothetical protein